ncbi:MAG: hypoxanthine phosphoribosyltransferase [Planctomycetaceae bacterium]|nr:hypoxanthine phosphoribosyltransferase [Planctomycetaceae bacterium]
MNVRPLISAEEIEQAVAAMGERVSGTYAGKPLTILAVLHGSIMLVADLMRRVTVPHQFGVVQASSYRGNETTSGELITETRFLPDIKGRDVLLVDDIFDTGKTLETLVSELQEFEPASIRSAVLLWKKSRQAVSMSPDEFCFDIPDEFVVGYGLDFNGEYRHLPYIGVLEST